MQLACARASVPFLFITSPSYSRWHQVGAKITTIYYSDDILNVGECMSSVLVQQQSEVESTASPPYCTETCQSALIPPCQALYTNYFHAQWAILPRVTHFMAKNLGTVMIKTAAQGGNSPVAIFVCTLYSRVIKMEIGGAWLMLNVHVREMAIKAWLIPTTLPPRCTI